MEIRELRLVIMRFEMEMQSASFFENKKGDTVVAPLA